MPKVRWVVVCVVGLAALLGVISRGEPQVHPAADASPSPVAVAYEAAGGEAGPLGPPLAPELCGLPGAGCFRTYAQGAVYWSPASGAHVLRGAVRDRWAAQGWERGALGYPLTDTTCGLADGGCYQHFQGGTVMSSTGTGAWAVSGGLRDGWFGSGSESGPLGYPTAAAVCGLRAGGCFQHFVGGDLYWSSASGAHAVSGTTAGAWAATGWEFGSLGYPVTESVCDSGGHCYQHFQTGTVMVDPVAGAWGIPASLREGWFRTGSENGVLGYPTGAAACGLRGGGCWQPFQKGALYSSPGSGAHVVSGGLRDNWASRGWEGGALGYPVTDTSCTIDFGGCYQHFQGGSLYSSGGTPPTMVQGAYRDRWAATGWQRGVLGYPTGERVCGLRDNGCFQPFQNGSIYSSSGSGLHMVVNSMYRGWAEQGWENGPFGYPTGEAQCGLSGGGCVQQFQIGPVYASFGVNIAHSIVPGPVREVWAATGWEAGPLGYPVSEQQCGLAEGGCVQRFDRGVITWTPAFRNSGHWLTLSGADAWDAEGGPAGLLGYPVNECQVSPYGETCVFEHGYIDINYRYGLHRVYLNQPGGL